MIKKLHSTAKGIPGEILFLSIMVMGNGIEQTIFSGMASHHRSCYQKINPMRIAQTNARGGQKCKLD